jgi:hypothetical protein
MTSSVATSAGTMAHERRRTVCVSGYIFVERLRNLFDVRPRWNRKA